MVHDDGGTDVTTTAEHLADHHDETVPASWSPRVRDLEADATWTIEPLPAVVSGPVSIAGLPLAPLPSVTCLLSAAAH